MTTKAEQVERLTILADEIEAHPERFDMNTWVFDKRTQDDFSRFLGVQLELFSVSTWPPLCRTAYEQATTGEDRAEIAATLLRDIASGLVTGYDQLTS